MRPGLNRKVSRLAATVAALTFVQACTTASQDVSTGGPAASMTGFGSFLFFSYSASCTLHPEPAYGGRFKWGTSGGGTRELTVDAGETTLIARCHSPYGTGNGMVIFQIKTDSDQKYTVRPRTQEPQCLELVNLSDSREVISCEPYRAGDYLNLSTGGTSALLTGGHGTAARIRNKKPGDLARCQFKASGHKAATLMKIDPGETTLDVTCWLKDNLLGGKGGRTQFTFTAADGHEYAVSYGDDERLCLVDITAGQQSMDCQDYKPFFYPHF